MQETNQLVPDHNSGDTLNLEITYEYASTGQRFLNYLIDNLLMRFGLSFLTSMGVGVILGLVAPEYLQQIAYGENTFDVFFITYLVGVVNYLLYYTICEKAFRGYTLGKLITGTRVIRVDGGELTFKEALLRTLSRLVPFEPFSAFGGHPWHDTWTNTMVIKSR